MKVISKFKQWWGKLSGNEKIMFPLALALLIGIATRWRYVFGEIIDAFSYMFE